MEMTKMLLPAVPPVAKIHGGDERGVFYRRRASDYHKRLLLKLRESERERLERQTQQNLILRAMRDRYEAYEHYGQLLHLPRFSFPTAHEGIWNSNLTTVNEEKSTKIQSESQLQPESKLKSEPVQESVQESEQESESELKSESKSESEPKSQPEPESKPELKPNLNSGLEAELKFKLYITEPESKLKFSPEVELALLAEQYWKRELRRESSPSPVAKFKDDLGNESMTSTEMWKIYNEEYASDSDIDYIPTKKDNYEQQKSKLNMLFAKYRKTFKRKRFFMSRQKANLMLSATITYGNINPENQNRMLRLQSQYGVHEESNLVNPENQNRMLRLPRCSRSVQTPAPKLVNRSLLKQNINNVLPSMSSCAENHCLSSDNQEKKSHENQNQDYQEKIGTSFNHLMKNLQIEEEEENQDVEMKHEALSDDDKSKIVTDTNEELPLSFRHAEFNGRKIYEYISEGTSLMSKASLKNEKNISQRIKRHWRKNEENQRQNDIKKNTLNDHCYHLNEPRSFEQLRIQEHSESDEEIDVVSLVKQANIMQILELESLRLKANKAAKPVANDISTLRRPRGRPPGPNSARRQKDAQYDQVLGPVSRRGRIQRTVRQQNTLRDEDQSEDEDDNQRRRMHNNMERMRRVDMKTAFDTLKNCIPQISNNQKVSKVSILKHATKYNIETRDNLDILEPELKRLIKEHKVLHNRFAKFKSFMKIICKKENCFLEKLKQRRNRPYDAHYVDL